MQQYEDQLNVLVKVIRNLGIEVKSVVDAGARDCKESLAFKNTFPNASITAFECNPANIPICRENVKGTSIRLVDKALSDKEGMLDFHVLASGDNGSSSIYTHKELSSQTVKVVATTLEKELEVLPTVLWIDAQGAELSILKGCGDKIREISIIHTEVYFRRAYHDQPLYKDVKKYLFSKGFRLLMFSSVPAGFSDAIFINEKIKKPLPSWLIEANEYTFKRLLGKIKRTLVHN